MKDFEIVIAQTDGDEWPEITVYDYDDLNRLLGEWADRIHENLREERP